MKIKSKQSIQTSRQNNSKELESDKTFQSLDESNDKKYISPKKPTNQKIFVQTPQAVFIPINQRQEENLHDFQCHLTSKEVQNKNQQNNIFKQDSKSQSKQCRQVSILSTSSLDISGKSLSNVVKSKTSICFKEEKISQFFYYQNFIVCKALRKVIVYNLFTKSLAQIPINCDEFVLTPFAPYVFNCITGQYLNLYSENAVEKYMELEKRREIKKKKDLQKNETLCTNSSKPFGQTENLQLSQRQNLQMERSPQYSAIDVMVIKISKLEVYSICKHSQSYFMGGYNKSVLPGGKRTERREVYEMQHLDPKINNKPKNIIKLQPSFNPVTIIQVQMPYLIIYCNPKFYLFGLKSHELLLTFAKEMKHSILLQGRYAFNVINGVGISYKNNKSTIFTFDLESSPIYGVEITEHKQEANCLCLQKTGRIFGSHGYGLFEYIPSKRITRCVKLYSKGENIIWIESTPSNNLLVLRQTSKLEYVIEAFTIDENTISDF